MTDPKNHTLMGMSFWDGKENMDASEGAYYAREMENQRDQFEGGQWMKDVFEVLAQA